MVHLLFVHTGRTVPYWFFNNVLTTASQFGDVVVAASDNSKLLRALEARDIAVFHYVKDDRDRQLEAASAGSAYVRNGFWVHAIRRFLVLNQFQEVQRGPVWMIESDVVLLPGFGTWLSHDHSSKCLMPFPIEDRVIGSTIFCPDATVSRNLAEYCIAPSELGARNNDMHLLFGFAMDFHGSVAFLPSAEYQSRVCVNNLQSDERAFASRIWDEGKQVWDAASLGQYLFGYDPRNSFGIRRSLNPKVRLGAFPNLTGLESDGRSLRVVYEDEHTFEVMSLHVHSKDKRAFQQGSFERLLEQRGRHQLLDGDRELTEFSPSAFVSSMKEIGLLGARKALRVVSRQFSRSRG